MNSQENMPIALVTGVGRAEGIGFELCRQLAARGMTVLLTARTHARAQPLADMLIAEGLDVRPFALDVTADEPIQHTVAAVAAEFGRLDILVNNAAATGPFGEKPSDADLQTVAHVMAVNLYGVWRTCQAFLPLLRKSRSARIVNVSSGVGSHDDPLFGLTRGNKMGSSYGVSKAAVNAFTATLAEELKGSGILVNAVCPGFTATFPGAEAMGARPVSEGAAGIVWAATLPDDGPTGGFFRDGQKLPW
ncbi:MAG: SDR family NAD(P)-dependent oxidoreductase [Chloroflexales bacterium]|nr:SDR family NAD(P)-dependent oxidoreductase [Chloroflexales bacterium]